MTQQLSKSAAVAVLVVSLTLALAAPASAAPRVSQDGEIASLQPIIGWFQGAWAWVSEPLLSLWSALGGEIDPDGQQ